MLLKKSDFLLLLHATSARLGYATLFKKQPNCAERIAGIMDVSLLIVVMVYQVYHERFSTWASPAKHVHPSDRQVICMIFNNYSHFMI